MGRGEAEFVTGKSRFIGHGAPARTEEDALNFLADARRDHRDASHNCYAYIIGANMGVMRYSDDGEPGGTAGLPIIETMKSREVTDCCVVVTRYFGGVLLGAGGLARAYARGASAALDASRVAEMHPTERYAIEAPYRLYKKIEYCLQSMPVIVEDKAFDEYVTITMIIKCGDAGAFIRNIAELSDGTITPALLNDLYYPWPA
jgi:uncharacterized YigZ family protein